MSPAALWAGGRDARKKNGKKILKHLTGWNNGNIFPFVPAKTRGETA
jgi:hypothetical protein